MLAAELARGKGISSSFVVGAHRATAAPPKVQTFHGAWGQGSEGLEQALCETMDWALVA